MKRNTFDNVLNTPSGKERVVPDINLGNIENMNSSNTQTNSLTNQKLINQKFSKQNKLKQKLCNQSHKYSECDTKVDSDNISRNNETNLSDENITFGQKDNLFCEEELDNSMQNSTTKEQPKKVIDTTKYKTEMCKNWQSHGYCNYGKKCKFAHGGTELEKKQV